MQEKMYFHLLILCGIWSLGITQTFADEEIKESSEFFIRHKRVVSHVPGEDARVSIGDFRYVVVIKHLSRISCTGSILSTRIVITAASCVSMNPDEYQIVYGTSTSNRATHKHDVIDIRKHLGIALLTTREHFMTAIHGRSIQLHSATLLLPSGTVGQVTGWGFNFRSTNRGTNYPEHLRSIQVQIIAHQHCVNRYLPDIEISDNEICTYHPQRHSGHTDFGAGLVVNGRLAGVFIGSGLFPSRIDSQYPDVFANLQHPDYNQWIMSSMREIRRVLEIYD